MLNYFSILSLLLSLLICINSQANTADKNEITAAHTVIDGLHSHLLESMQTGENWSYTERYQFLSPIIQASFDFEIMSKLVLSRHWRNLSEIKKQAFMQLMQRLTTANYASRFRQFNDEKFTVLNSEEAKKQRILVKTEITTADKTHELNYVLHKPEKNWLIISIMADGINEVAIKRGEYASILKQENFDALIQKIEEQISRLKTQ